MMGILYRTSDWTGQSDSSRLPILGSSTIHSARALKWLVLLCLLSLGGCGQSGPDRFDISGTVTFHGQPVRSGMISFDPVSKSLGGGYARIQDGKFDTSQSGRGHLGDAHVIHIHGDAEETPTSDSSGKDSYTVKKLFPAFDKTVTLPKNNTVMSFDVGGTH